MKKYSAFQRLISRLLLLCILVSLVPTGVFAQQEAGEVASKPETKAAATDYRETIDALAPPYHVRDYLPTLADGGASILGGGAYYFALPYDNGTKAHVLDLTGRFHRDEFFLSVDLSISNDTLVGVDTDLAFDCTKVYTGENLEKWRFRMYPVHGMTFRHASFSDDGSYMVPVIGGAENYAASSHDGLMGLHTYRKYTGDADYVHYTLTYDSSLGGFRFKRNVNNPDSADNRLMAFKVAIQGAELYHAIQDVRDLAYGNGDGRYDATLYSNFITCLKEALELYRDNNKLVDSDTQASLRTSMDAKATELLGHRAKLVKSDNQTSFIDIPVELLDFRADGFMFEYSDSAYGLIKDVSANANIYSYSHEHDGKDLTLPTLIDRQMIYTEDTVNYVANVISEGYRTDLSVSNKVPGWNSVFYNKSQTITEMGDWDSTLGKTDTEENGGVLKWKEVETFYDMAYYILNNLWRSVDETDSEEFIDQYNLTYGRKIPEIDRLRMYIDEDGMYTLDAGYEILRDGYYLFNQYPRVSNRIVYDSPVFIPADGLGFEEPTLMEKHGYGDTDAGTWFYGSKFDCEKANFHFTMHAYGSFVYYQSQNQEFTFVGDDDVYFYVNGQIALDIGAAHEALGGTIRLNDIAEKLGLVDGEVYDFDMFYAERHTTASNLRFSTNIKIVDAQTLTTKGQYLERSAGESYVDKQLGTGSPLIDNAAVKVGDTVAYSFELLNRRPVPVFDVSFKDTSLGAELTPNAVYLYDPAKTNGAVTGEKDITFFYRSYDTETGTVDTSNPQFVTLTEMKEIINSVLVRPDGVDRKEYDSFPVGSYAVTTENVSQIKELLALGVPRNCKLSVYGFKRNTVAGDTPYTNTVSSHCSYKRALSAESNIEQEEVFYIDGIASRVLQVTAALPDAVRQEFVLDYGKALEIPLDYLRSSIRTDSLVQVDSLVGLSRTGRNAEHLKNLPKDVICTKVGDREALGQGTLTRGDTALVYQLTDFMDRIERVYAIYSMKGCNTIDQDGNVTEYKYITVEILLIPATMMYYESDFAVGAISVDDPCNTLLFDFKNTEEDRLRYQNAAYGGFNFDLGGKGFWATHATEAGKSANYTNWYIDNESGTLSVYVGDDLEGEKNACGPKIMTTNTYTMFPWTGRGKYAPLKFNPEGAEVLEVRFRVDGCVQDEYLTSPAVEMEFHYNDAQGVDHIAYGHSRTEFSFTQGQYITRTLTLSSTFKSAAQITSLGLRFVGIKSPSEDAKGTVTIDYIYVGPVKQAAVEPKIFMDFTNDEAAQLRYTQSAYNGYNFDREENPNWSVGGTAGGEAGLSIDNADGALTIHKIRAAADENGIYGPYLSVSKDYGSYPWSKEAVNAPWNLTLNGEDVIRIRFKTDGCQTVAGEPKVQLLSHYTDSSGAAVYKAGIASAAYTHVDGKYTTVDILMPTELLTAKSIQSLGFRFLDLKSDGTGSLTVDYILVCKKAEEDSILAQSRSGWSIATDASTSDAYQDLDMNTATATQSGNAILRQLHSDTQVQPDYYGPQNALEKLENGTPLSFTHRAAWETVPQNSLLGVYESIMLGIDGAEIDLRLSKNGVLVLCHDDHIRSYTTVSKNATDEESLVVNLDWADLKTKAVVGPYATGSQDLAYPISEAQASILNSLPEYLNHYGAAAKAGDKLTMARLDDVLDLVKQYGPNTLLTLDKMDSAEIFAASYKLVRDKGMLDRVIFKCSRAKATFDSWITAAATACGIAESTVKSSMHMMYVAGASTASNLTEIKNHVNNGGYLQSVEITYGADTAASAEAGIRSTLKPYCQTNDIALYGSSIGESYCGGKNDAEGTWAYLLALGFDGIMTDAPTELAAYMNAYNTQKAASQTIQAEHFQSCNNETMHFRLQQNRDANGNKLVRGMQNGDYLVYENISFTGTESKLYFRTQGLQHGAILRFYLDEISSGNCLAAYSLGMDAEPYTLSTSLRISVPAGMHRVIVQVSGVEDVELLHFDSFSFAPEQHYLFFDFNDTPQDRERYSTGIYQGKNFDTMENWVCNNSQKGQISSGGLQFHTYGRSFAFVQQGTSFATADQPLRFIPGKNDWCHIRLKIDNAVLEEGKKAMLYLYFGVNQNRPNTYREEVELDLDAVNNQGYFELSFPIKNAAYISAEYISAVRVYVDYFTGTDENGADITMDYLYLGPVRPTESLYFDFANGEADQLRYKDPVYGGDYNYDKEGEGGYWATHSTAVDATDPAEDRERNQKNYTIDNSSGTFTLQVGDSKEGESKHGPKFMTSNQYGVYPWTGRGQYAPLRFNPASAEVIVVRFKLTNCEQASGEDLELQVDMHFRDSNGTLYNRYSVTKVPYSAVNDVYQTVTIPLSDFATRVPLLTSIGLRFVGIKKPSATDVGTVTIDYLYMGPRSESPAEQALYFDFSHSVSDQQRYNSPVYGYLDYDLEGEGYWATYATHNDAHEDGTINERNYSMDNSAGTLTVSVGDGLEGESSAYGPKIMTTKTYGVYPYRSRGQHAPLHFDPTNAKYLEVRFRLDNVKKQAAMTMQMEYHYHKIDGTDTIAYENTKVPYELRLGEYQTIQIPLSSTFKNAQDVTSLGLRFLGICSEDSQELGRVTIDYIYVGREECLPSKVRPVYGWDSSYTDDSKLSNGSSYFVHGQGAKLSETTENYTQFSFDFVGTGFDLISRTGAKQTSIQVHVYKANDRSKAVKIMTVNNKGELELYQIPVVSVQGLEHGAYYVTVGVHKATESNYDFLCRGGEFHFDALRIYDPIPSDTVTDPEAFETYRKDLEAYPYIKEIRDILLSAEDFDALTGSKDGAIFIDTENFTPTKENQTESASGHITANVSTYNKLGPKNEVYLHPGQAVAFRVEIDAVETQLPVSIDVGAKTILGDEAELVAGFVTPSTTTTGAVLTAANRITAALATSTSQYYALELDTSVLQTSTNGAGQTISAAYLVILNNSPVTTDIRSRVISITDIKCAYDRLPTVSLPEDDNDQSDSTEIKRTATVESAPVRFVVDGRTMEAAEVFIGSKVETPLVETQAKLYHSLNLASDISLNYAVKTDDFATCQGLHLDVTLPVYEGDGTVAYVSTTLEAVEKDSYYYFTLDGITAVQMNDTLTARLYWSENGASYCSQEDEYSVARYAYAQLNKSNASRKLKTLCADLLRYGATAQSYKNYRMDALADASMNQEHKSFLSDTETISFNNNSREGTELTEPKVTWVGKALDLNSKVGIVFVIAADHSQVDPTALRLQITYVDAYGNSVVHWLEKPETYGSREDNYSFCFDSLLASELRTVLTATVYYGDTPVSNSLTYSADTYGNNKTGTLLALCKALFAYSDSAKTYLTA